MASALQRKIKSFTAVPLNVKLLFAEAVLTSAYVKITLLIFPFKKVASWLGTVQNQAEEVTGTTHYPLIKNMQFALKLCDRYTPWPTECYTRSLTAKIMLKRRSLPSTLYFGFMKDANNRLKGHSWLKSSGIVVTGFCDFSKYQVHSSFS
jgi:hypothetical protein